MFPCFAAQNVTVEEILSSYKQACQKLNCKPISKVLKQIQVSCKPTQNTDEKMYRGNHKDTRTTFITQAKVLMSSSPISLSKVENPARSPAAELLLFTPFLLQIDVAYSLFTSPIVAANGRS